MADARRFPRLELPFAVVGAAAGFLSTGLLCNPLVDVLPRHRQPMAVITAAVVAALTGFVVRRLCVRKPLRYELDEPHPLERAPWDRAGVHLGVIVLAGALIGSIVGATCNCRHGATRGFAGGAICALVFVPVVLAVLAAARSAQRARLGTLVAGSDRRAVWSILATALAVTTLEALPDWHYLRSPPWVAWSMVALASLGVLAVFAIDRRAARLVERAVADLSCVPEVHGEATSMVDLGLGEEVGAHVARSQVAYRDRDRVIDLVRGDPSLVRVAMARAQRRALASCALIAVVLSLHAVALAPF